MRTVLTLELHTRLRAEGLDTAQIAEATGLKVESVKTAEVRRGFREPDPDSYRPYSPEEVERIRCLAEEGMIAAFIAEDLGRGITSIRALVARLAPNVDRREFSRIWTSIRRNPELRRLHDEFKPKGIYR